VVAALRPWAMGPPLGSLQAALSAYLDAAEGGPPRE